MISLCDVLPASNCGVWGFSADFSKNVICGHALHLLLLWFLMFEMFIVWNILGGEVRKLSFCENQSC